MWRYEKYLERREELIKQGKSFPEASEQAHREVSGYLKGEDLLSPKNR